MATLQWIDAKRNTPENGGVLIQKEDGTSFIVKIGDSIVFDNELTVHVVGFRFSRMHGKEADPPKSIMFKTDTDEQGECFTYEHDSIRHTGYGAKRTGLASIRLVQKN